MTLITYKRYTQNSREKKYNTYTEKIERNINGQPFVKNSDQNGEKVSGLVYIIAKYTLLIAFCRPC